MASEHATRQCRRLNWRIKDFCEASGIGKTKFYVLVKSGKIHLVKCGRISLVPDAEVQRFQAALEAGEL